MKESKVFSLFIILIAYIVAIAIGIITYIYIPLEFYFKLLISDIPSFNKVLVLFLKVGSKSSILILK